VSGGVPEVWLCGPVGGVHALLQPVAHTLIQVGEDIRPVTDGLTPEQLWHRPAGVWASLSMPPSILRGTRGRS
jgi:hypothetical protein